MRSLSSAKEHPHSLCHTRTYFLSLSLSLSLSRSLTCSHTHTFPFSHSLTLSLSHSLSLLSFSDSLSLTHTHTHTHTHTFSHSLAFSLSLHINIQNSLWYAKDRRAMRSLSGAKEPEKAADLLMVHPSVRRMLLTQKAITEGGRSMLYECAVLHDKMIEARLSDKPKLEQEIDDRMGFLTPILKGFLTEVGTEVANIGVQVYGGHGYIKSNKQEQILRDVRISTVWEGTTQIQALDLLGRKVLLQKMKPINEHCSEVAKFAWGVLTGGKGKRVQKHAMVVLYKTLEWLVLSYRIGYSAAKDKDFVGAASVEYLMYSGYVSLAYHWLKMEVAAEKSLAEGGQLEPGFYAAKIETSHFYFENVLPRTRGLIPVMLAPLDSLMAMPSASFSFDHNTK